MSHWKSMKYKIYMKQHTSCNHNVFFLLPHTTNFEIRYKKPAIDGPHRWRKKVNDSVLHFSSIEVWLHSNDSEWERSNLFPIFVSINVVHHKCVWVQESDRVSWLCSKCISQTWVKSFLFFSFLILVDFTMYIEVSQFNKDLYATVCMYAL